MIIRRATGVCLSLASARHHTYFHGTKPRMACRCFSYVYLFNGLSFDYLLLISQEAWNRNLRFYLDSLFIWEDGR